MLFVFGAIHTIKQNLGAGMGDNPRHGAAGGSSQSFDNAVEVGS